jgi:hypothetical protein
MDSLSRLPPICSPALQHSKSMLPHLASIVRAALLQSGCVQLGSCLLPVSSMRLRIHLRLSSSYPL